MDFEQDLRDSLQHSADAIGSGDSPLETIRSRGRRRKAWKAAGGTFGIVAVVGFAALGISALVSPAEKAPVADSTMATTQAPVTTGPPPPTSAAPAAVYPTPFLIEGDERVLAVGTDGTEQVVYRGRYHAVASDGAGGLVFQQEIAIEDQARHRATIYRVLAGTTEPLPLVEQAAGHIIEMFGVEDVDGVPTLLYTDRTGMDSPETAQTMLIAHDLGSGETRELGVVGGWESGIRTVSYGAGIYAMAASAEGEEWFRYLDAFGEEYFPYFDPHPGCQVGDVRCPEVPVMGRTGELVTVHHRFLDPAGDPIDLSSGEWVIVNDQGIVAYVSGIEESIITEFREVVEIVAHDLGAGPIRVLYSFESGGAEGMDSAAVVDIDFDGRYLAIHDGRGELDAPVVIVDTGSGTVVPFATVGVPRFPLSPFDLPGTVIAPGD
jgi:hypothetical protein